jgi:hypothetical protein
MKGKRSWLPDEEGQLSIDFIIGFTIFMISFIFVISMASGLLVGLQSRTIDYDAVAYRTSVMLVEDPGEPRDWHLLDLTIPADRDSLKRLGLSISRLSPGLLQQQKVDAFFNWDSSAGCSGTESLCYPDGYKEKLIFGDYPYSFNIALRKLNESTPLVVGGNYPPKYGYSRRVVKIKQPGANMTLELLNKDDGFRNTINISMEFSDFYSLTNPLYRFDPLHEDTIISIENVTSSPKIENPIICIYPPPPEGGSPTCIAAPASSPTIRVKNKTSGSVCLVYPCAITNDTQIYIEDGFFRRIDLDEFSTIEIRLVTDEYVFPAFEPAFDYNSTSLAAPEPAVLEVRVW